jgi:4-hydroxy-tetrahydrodipicolinate reductase
VFAPPTRRRLGIGHDARAFAAGVADGTIAGHVGFRESLRLLCASMGRGADRIEVETTPVLATSPVELADGSRVDAGDSVGAAQRAEAWLDGRPWISVEMLLHAAPASAGLRTTDEAHLEGQHALHVTVDPGCGAIMSTAALLVNGIPRALAAGPGLHGPGDLAPVAPWLADAAPPAAAAALAITKDVTAAGGGAYR